MVGQLVTLMTEAVPGINVLKIPKAGFFKFDLFELN